jgi:hypothetical protein
MFIHAKNMQGQASMGEGCRVFIIPRKRDKKLPVFLPSLPVRRELVPRPRTAEPGWGSSGARGVRGDKEVWVWIVEEFFLPLLRETGRGEG